jgi:signal transduction histidine kinase
MSLKRRLTLTLCTLILLLLLSVSYMIYDKSAAIINQDTKEYMTSQLERAKENIDLLLAVTRLETENLTGDLMVRRFVDGALPPEALSAYLTETMARRNANDRHYMDLFILDLTGHIVATAMEDAQGLDLSTRDYYLESVATEQTVTSDILVARSDASLIIITVSPIRDDAGNVVAHAGVSIYAEYLSSVIEDLKLGDNGYYIILDSDNLILSHPDASRIATEATFDLPENLRNTDSEAGSRPSANSPVLQSSNKNENDNLMMFKRMDSNQWVLIAVLPEAEMRQKSMSLLSDVILIGLVISVLAVFAAIYLASKISEPIVAITRSIDLAARSSQRLSLSVSEAARDLQAPVTLFNTNESLPVVDAPGADREIRNLSGSYRNFRETLNTLLKSFSFENEHLQKQSEALTTAIETRNEQTAKFVSVLSHELRTSLTLVKGYSKALSSDMEIDALTRRKFLEGILNGAEDLEHITSDILDSAYEAQSEPKLNLVTLEAAPFIERLCENTRRYVQDAGYPFEGQCQGADGFVTLDPIKITRAWNNLLSNAVKYSSKNCTIHVDLCTHDNRLMFRIRDEGIGIPLDEQSQIFEMFYMGSHDRRKGYGLGLFIARSFVEAHGSKLNFSSEVGKGTTFWFELKLDPAASQTASSTFSK